MPALQFVVAGISASVMPDCGHFGMVGRGSVCSCDLRLTSALVLDVHFDDPRRCPRSEESVLALFEKHRNDQLRIASRRHADKPNIPPAADPARRSDQ